MSISHSKFDVYERVGIIGVGIIGAFGTYWSVLEPIIKRTLNTNNLE